MPPDRMPTPEKEPLGLYQVLYEVPIGYYVSSISVREMLIQRNSANAIYLLSEVEEHLQTLVRMTKIEQKELDGVMLNAYRTHLISFT
jgi:hypothetical protein